MSENDRKSFEKRDRNGNATRKRKKFDVKKKFGQRIRPKDAENQEIKRLESLYTEVSLILSISWFPTWVCFGEM